MESITIYPKNAKQKFLLMSLMEELKIRFEEATSKEKTLYSEGEFFAKIDESIAQAANSKTKTLSRDNQKEFLGL